MTDDERKDLLPGDVVRVRDDSGAEAEYEVRWAPWQLASGEWVVGLKGIVGGYLLARVVGVVSRAGAMLAPAPARPGPRCNQCDGEGIYSRPGAPYAPCPGCGGEGVYARPGRASRAAERRDSLAEEMAELEAALAPYAEVLLAGWDDGTLPAATPYPVAIGHLRRLALVLAGAGQPPKAG